MCVCAEPAEGFSEVFSVVPVLKYLIDSLLVKKFPAFCEIRKFIRVS